MKIGSIVKIKGSHVPVGDFNRSPYAGKTGLIVKGPPCEIYYHVLIGPEIQIFSSRSLVQIQ